MSTHSHNSALKFITCGSVDDGKSTLIGRLLIDSKSVLQDQLAHVSKSGEADLALFTDGLSAEREQGITIDVAYRYFNTAKRKFIIGDAPGHEQYTRNMVTAASSADAAVVLVDSTKLNWKNPLPELLVQTRRHSLLLKLLRVPSIVFAINKLDALGDNATLAFGHIREALRIFTQEAGIEVKAIVPISALKGHNVVKAEPNWCGYTGESLLDILENLPNTPVDSELPFAFAVQWVERVDGKRVFWGRVSTGVATVGQEIKVLPSGQTAVIAAVHNHIRVPQNVRAGHGAGIVLDREVDVSRGDWLGEDVPASAVTQELQATVAWLDDEPLIPGRAYWALHGHRWIKARVRRIHHRLNVNTLAEEDASELPANSIGHIELLLQEPVPAQPYATSRILGSMVLVDTASHKTAGAIMVR